MSQQRRDTLALLLYCALIFFLSSRPTLPMPPSVIPFMDKWIHATAYAVMGWLAWHAWRHRLRAELVAPAAVLFCSLYGISDEWHQSFVPGRDADPLDWLADTVGGAIGTSLARQWHALPRKNS